VRSPIPAPLCPARLQTLAARQRRFRQRSLSTLSELKQTTKKKPDNPGGLDIVGEGPDKDEVLPVRSPIPAPLCPRGLRGHSER
jgi:hypothetical protein